MVGVAGAPDRGAVLLVIASGGDQQGGETTMGIDGNSHIIFGS